MCGAFLENRCPAKASIFQAERITTVLPHFLKTRSETRQKKMRDSGEEGLCSFCIERTQIAPRLNPESWFFCETAFGAGGHCFVISPEA